MTHAADVLRRDADAKNDPGYRQGSGDLLPAQARALADLVEEVEQRTEAVDNPLDRLEDPLCVLVDAVEAAFEAEP
ncbi:MAG TPA: hypothetical protein VFW92_08525 [Candidatus Limnocylindrales bacterium]|nr:hypothetical protein [Candidatus Limnocylindrales bacterium]